MSDFSAVADAIIRARLKDDPVSATWAGLHDFDAEMTDVSADGFTQARADLKAHLAKLAEFTPGDLDPAERLDHRLLTTTFEVELREREEHQLERHDPSLYASLAADALYSLLARDYAPLAERLPAVIARLRQVPAVLAAGKRNLVRSPRIWNTIALEETDATVEFYNDTVAPLLPGDDGRSALQAALDALADYRHFLEVEHASRNGMPFAIGRDFFDYKLKHEHVLPYSAGTLLEFGDQAVASTEMRLAEVAAVIDRSAQWPQALERLRDEHPPEDKLLEEYRRGVDEARRFIVERRLVTVPPGETLKVVETPLFQRPTTPYAAYMAPGIFEKRQLGLYYVTPVDAAAPEADRREQLRGHNRFNMLLTNVHEGYPGHHLQLVLANGVPSLARRYVDSTVFAEGWALYCEQMMLDEGLSDDPRVRLFQLKDQLWRACRVVIDVKLQIGEMTFDQAVDMLVDVAKLERSNAIGEVKRYTMSPTQPMSYLVGKQQIMDFREREQRRLGAEFELRRFHDRLLSQGTIPVALVESALEVA